MTKAPKHFIQIPVITAKQSDISSTDKLVFGEIYTMLNTNDKCWLTNVGIGDRINKNKATVRNSIKKLRKFGYIKTKIVPNGREHSKRYVYADELGGTKLGTTKFGHTKESTPVVPNKVRRSYQIKSPSKSQSISINKSVTNDGKTKLRRLIQKDLWTLGVTNINSIIWDAIDDWVDNYPPQMIRKAIHQVALTSPSPSWAVTDIKNQLLRGCKTYQPKRRSSYGHKPVKQQLPKWATEKYDPKKHKADPKLVAKIEKHVKQLHNGDGKK